MATLAPAVTADDRPALGRRRSELRGALALTGRALGLGAAVALGVWFSIGLTRSPDGVAAIWPSTGLVAAALLVAPRRHWPAYLAAALLGNAAVRLLAGDPPALVGSLPIVGTGEALFAAMLWQSLAGGATPDLTRPRQLLRFAAIAGIAAPSVSTFCGTTVIQLLSGVPFWRIARVWFPADAAGLVIVTPLGLALCQERLRDVLRPRRLAAMAAILTLITATGVLVFAQSRFPLLFMTLPPLLLAASSLGFAGAAIGVATLAAISVGFTAHHLGPLSLMHGADVETRMLVLQLFLLVVSSSVLQAASMLSERARLIRAVRDSEAGFRQLAEHAGDLVSRVGQDGVRRYVSPACERVLGLRPDALVGTRLAEHVHPEDRARFKAMKLALLSGATAEQHELIRILRADGSVAWMEITARAVRDPVTGAPDGYVSVGRDVTVRQEIEAQHAAHQRALEAANDRLSWLTRHLAKARDSAQAATRAKGHFLATMSHELRTPLHGILGYAELLHIEGGLNETQAGRVDAMLSAGKHLLDMIERVLDLSQIEAGRLELHVAGVDIRAVAASCLELVRTIGEAKGLTMTLACEAAVPETLQVDPARLRQMLLNLLGNAVKFTERGGIELRLRGAPRGIRIEVVDTGRGVPAAMRELLFNEFQRLGLGSGKAADAIEGAGLGLAITARLAALMDGTIGHEPNPAGGSIFWLHLPCTQAAAVPDAARPVAAPAAPPVRTRTVLVADDVELNRDVVSGFLRTAGHAVTCVADGAEAVAVAQAGGFDAILMDVRMPVMDGLEATRRIRALGGPAGSVPILALTAGTSREQQEACQEAGMDGHVAKPFTLQSLLAALDAARPRRTAEPPVLEPPPAAALAEPVIDLAVFNQTRGLLQPEPFAAHLAALNERMTDVRAKLHSSRAAGGKAPAELIDGVHALAGAAGLFGFRQLSFSCRAFEECPLPAQYEALLGAIQATLAVQAEMV